jgi:hypothetical protein
MKKKIEVLMNNGMKIEMEEVNSAYHWIWKCCGGSDEGLGIRR